MDPHHIQIKQRGDEKEETFDNAFLENVDRSLLDSLLSQRKAFGECYPTQAFPLKLLRSDQRGEWKEEEVKMGAQWGLMFRYSGLISSNSAEFSCAAPPLRYTPLLQMQKM